MVTALEMDPEHDDDDRCMVFLKDSQMSGLVIDGYDDDGDAMVDLLLHLRAMFEANGKKLDIVVLGEEGVDRA